MKHLFIVNPVAGGKDKTEFVQSEAAKAFSDTGALYEIYVTKCPMDACDKIKTEAASGNELRVYACGGDGTLNECVNGAVGFDNVAVTHFPCGTGNDFIKMFGEEKSGFFDLKKLVDGDVRPIDVIDCNGRYSVNICSVGIDARIGGDVHKYSKIPIIGGATGYVTSTVVNVCKGIKQHFRVDCGGRKFDSELTLICACNGRYYGGGFNPVPTARPDDGIIDFLIVDGVSRLTFAALIGKYSRGQFRRLPQIVTYIRSDSMNIRADEDVVVNIDGEIIRDSSISLKAVPGGVNFIFPAKMRFFENQNEENGAKISKTEEKPELQNVN